MKRDVERYCNQCLACKKANLNVPPQGLYTALPISNELRIDLSMHFIVGLAMSKKGKDAIFVVVD